MVMCFASSSEGYKKPRPVRFNASVFEQDLKFQRSATRQRRLVYVDIPGIAGDAICALAISNNLTVNRRNKCFPQPRDQALLSGSRAQQIEFLKSTTYDFVRHGEVLSSDALRNTHVKYMTLLRNPYMQTMAHFRETKGDIHHADSFHHFRQWLQATPDNMQVRHICGTSCMNVPRGQLTRNHLKLAMRRLDKFTVLGIVERMPEILQVADIELGWTSYSPSSVMNTTEAQQDENALQRYRSHDGMIQELVRMNVWDMALYHHVEYMMDLRVASIMGSDFAATNANCTTPSCGRA
ncbi:hypothetical protein CYMTET_17690 [Cymbomonas tetramitiformis]|uniref:Sulfotransferase n=1 Tax=Cymbomonas tetramitiformis TaxID=36881 RepID=A0AAE0L726_9CHLO|nr:hypothetical protein CYMTET_17690 [Cymbomonas tetramitiformis]